MEGFKQELPPEEVIDGGLGLLVRKKRLYHGSGYPDIQRLNPAEETTVGEGIYFTSSASDALGYATGRSRDSEQGVPTVYGAQIENLKFLDLRDRANLDKILPGYIEAIQNELKKTDLRWNYEANLVRILEIIQSEKVNNLTQIVQNISTLFTQYVTSLGYNGLITYEGGESDYVGKHDTYLVFDPDKIKKLEIENE